MCYLGVDVDDNLTWEVHVKSLIKVLSYKLNTINKTSKFMNSTLLNMIYARSTVMFRLCMPSLGNCSEGNKFSLLRLQKQAARKVLKKNHFENSSGVELIKCLGWQSLEQQRDFTC